MLQITGTGDTILNQLRGAGILLESPCNGKGLCGKCRVRLLRGKAGPVTPEEKAFLTSEELHSGIRLACLAVPEGPVEVDPPTPVPHWAREFCRPLFLIRPSPAGKEHTAPLFCAETVS